MIILRRMKTCAVTGTQTWATVAIAPRCVRRAIVLAAALLMFACASLGPAAGREELADAERAFAADSLARGIRASFIGHFAPDGLVFEPQPVRVRETWPTRPPADDARTLRLAWHPELVEVARAGDLGYSTGPFELVDTGGRRATIHGVYFSVWQRQSDGQWKVWLDLGARTAAPVDDSAWSRRPRVPTNAQAAEHATATEVTELDRGLSGLDAAAFVWRLALDARRNENGAPPLIGAAWNAWLAQQRMVSEYTPREARVSASGDLAASYGTLVRRGPEGAPRPGYYVHVWLRNGGAWWLAVESIVDDEP